MRRSIVSTVVLLGALLGCSSSDKAATGTDPKTNPSNQIEIFSWWVAPGEAEPLQVLIDAAKSQDGVTVVNSTALDKGNARTNLAKRLADGDPPDAYQLNQYDDVSSLVPQDELIDSLNLRDKIFPDVLNELSRNGKIYGIPVNVHRGNTLYTSTAVMKKYKLEVPQTIQQMMAICHDPRLKADGVAAIGLGHEGWVLRTAFNAIGLGVMGPDTFVDFFKKEPVGRTSPDVLAKLDTLLDTFEDILTNCSNANAKDDGTGWTTIADLLNDGKIAMYLHGNWVTGYLQAQGATPGVDFDANGSPDSQEFFGYVLDWFSQPVGGPNPEGTQGFFKAVLSESAQAQFSALKGSSPARRDIDPSLWSDALAKRTYADLNSAKSLALLSESIDTAIGQYFIDRDKAAFRAAILAL